LAIIDCGTTEEELHICIDFQKLNAATKKDPYTLPFMNEVLDKVMGHEVYSFWMVFPNTIKFKLPERAITKWHSL
jgi:hypothetical protein